MREAFSREIFFVCSSISIDGELISEIISAKTLNEASSIFLEKFKLSPKIILGPFYKKKTQIIEEPKSFEFLVGKPRVAEYNGWLVKVHMLKQPSDHAYLIFTKRLDNKNILTPKGTTIVPISNLRFYE